MASTCLEVLTLALEGRPIPDALLFQALEEEDGRAFLSIVVERLGDSFEPALAATYEDLFTRAILYVAPELRARVWAPPSTSLPGKAERVYVLSRITLGADVAVTSVLMDAAKRRYADAAIVFVGPRKNFELFEGDPRIQHQEAPYARSGSLRDRIAASVSLWFDDGLVLDPDSRLTQLGLIQVCPPERFCFFPSRSFGGDSLDRLPDLAARWAGDREATPYVAPMNTATGDSADITVSLGVGENLSKRLGNGFELEFMQALHSTGARVLVDLGGSPEERARVERVLQPGMQTHSGAFAPFAAEISRSKLYVGYDSAGGHVASACGVPVISIARGFINERMAARWRPMGTVIDGDAANPIEAVRAAVAQHFR